MYDIPLWKRELNRRLAAIRERLGGDLRPSRPATCGETTRGGVRQDEASSAEEQRRWRR